MRRRLTAGRSITGPLLLIALGAALLARNWYPNLRLTDALARYWPYVLIVWGGVRVIEIFAAKFRGKTLPARGVSGSEWVLVAVFCLIGSGIHTAYGFAAAWPGAFSMGGVEVFGERFEYPVNLDKAVSGTARVVIEDLSGDVQVTGADANAVKISGQRIIRSMDRAAADELNRDSPVEISGDAGQVVIHLRGESTLNRSVAHALEITVPKGASIKTVGRRGDLRVANVAGTVELTGRGSDLELSDIGGPVTISGTYTGSVELQRISKAVEFNGARTELRAESIPGELRIALGDVRAANIMGPLRLSTRSNDVRLDGFANTVDLSTDRGDLDLRPGTTRLSGIHARARSGDIRISLPPEAQFTLKARSDRGDVTNDFSDALKKESQGRRTTLEGTVGSGPVIELETARGEIFVRKAGAEPAVPSGAPSKIDVLKKIEQ